MNRYIFEQKLVNLRKNLNIDTDNKMKDIPIADSGVTDYSSDGFENNISKYILQYPPKKHY